MPPGLLQIFEICRQPYNKLLTYCFGPDLFEFFIAPQSPPSEFSLRDTLVFLIVFDAHRRPMLIAEIKDDAGLVEPIYVSK